MSDLLMDNLLQEFVHNTHGVQSAAIVSREGFVIASNPEVDRESCRLGALSAIITTTCEDILNQLQKGSLDACLIQGSAGKFVLMGAGKEGMMVTVLQDDSHLEAIYTEM